MASNLLGAFVCDFIQEFSPHLLILFPPLLSIGVIDLIDRNALECSFLKRDESPNAGLQHRHPYFLQLRTGLFTIPDSVVVEQSSGAHGNDGSRYPQARQE